MIHNAEPLTGHRSVNSAGIEATVASHQRPGPFLLTSRLLPALSESGSRAGVDHVVRRGVCRSALFQWPGQMTDADYRGSEQYARAERAQVTLNEMWAQRVDRTAVVFHSLHPGWADTPGVEASLPQFRRLMRPLPPNAARQGARHAGVAWPPTMASRLRTSGDFWLYWKTPNDLHRLRSTRLARDARTPTAVVEMVSSRMRLIIDAMDSVQRRRIAVVGSGISGLTCAHVLGPRHDVVLFEADRRLGGHFEHDRRRLDPGVGTARLSTRASSSKNHRNYPNRFRLFNAARGSPTVDTENELRSHRIAYRWSAHGRVHLPGQRTRASLFAGSPQPGGTCADVGKRRRTSVASIAHARQVPRPQPATRSISLDQFLDAKIDSHAYFVELHLVAAGRRGLVGLWIHPRGVSRGDVC